MGRGYGSSAFDGRATVAGLDSGAGGATAGGKEIDGCLFSLAPSLIKWERKVRLKMGIVHFPQLEKLEVALLGNPILRSSDGSRNVGSMTVFVRVR